MSRTIFYVDKKDLPKDFSPLYGELEKAAKAAIDGQHGMVLYQIFANHTDTLKFQGGFLGHKEAKKIILDFQGQAYLDAEIEKTKQVQ